MSNHRVLLWEALKLTDGDVVEFGSGNGSTPYLRQHCKDSGRLFFSFDSNAEWAAITGATVISSWDDLNYQDIGVLFLDHAPGERRKVDLLKYKDVAKIIVIHDSEPTGAGDYRVRELFDQFKYKIELTGPAAWATMLSNHIDVRTIIDDISKEYSII